MGFGLFTLNPIHKYEELIPFTGPRYIAKEYKALAKYYPRLCRYVLREDDDSWVDGDVENGNVAGYINSSAQREELQNVDWGFQPYPRPWDLKEWGYTMTRALCDIAAGSEIFAFYPINL